THYGPAYGFAPKGVGEAALRWVRDENDRRMIDLALRLDAEAAVPEAEARLNACGSGAVAATLAAARELGAVQGYLVHYTTSFDVMKERMGRRGFDAAVGYAGLLF
ncbi:MAG: AmmeMemoRadiSam system protein B, partial [Planctomycetota bacterium]|nr:AmmeMemoRadiSam system protein B [Planctomycetota bacterium]